MSGRGQAACSAGKRTEINATPLPTGTRDRIDRIDGGVQIPVSGGLLFEVAGVDDRVHDVVDERMMDRGCARRNLAPGEQIDTAAPDVGVVNRDAGGCGVRQELLRVLIDRMDVKVVLVDVTHASVDVLLDFVGFVSSAEASIEAAGQVHQIS